MRHAEVKVVVLKIHSANIDSLSYPASLNTIICASRRGHFTLWCTTLTL